MFKSNHSIFHFVFIYSITTLLLVIQNFSYGEELVDFKEDRIKGDWGLTKKQKEIALYYHNYYRSITAAGKYHGQPSAANMLMMRYDEQIAEYAQKQSDKCNNKHGSLDHPKLGRMGQNIMFANQGGDIWISSSVFAWANEARLKNLTKVTQTEAEGAKMGHFTQVVWAKSDRVGCGYTRCKTKLIPFYCNYLPAGNYAGAKIYETGKPCSNCKKDFTCYNKTLCQSPTYDNGISSGNHVALCSWMLVASVFGSMSIVGSILPLNG